ncbi:hypothetical protein DPMN_064483 [Dreissena polymorpha]|uniref:Uncharacterized protein n=1 Tax=Dreissena polymorpha TaxID=45954 RepID=A0A9D4CD94_DREPO|nr:hypothetical protein DPMN_064483 [Dreissena polymorpha]
MQSIALFYLFLDNKIQEPLQDHNTPIPIDDRPIYILRFAYDNDLKGGTSSDLLPKY